jgi:hypothetical protein
MRKLSFLFVAFALVAFVSLTSCKSNAPEATPEEGTAVEEPAPAPAPVDTTTAPAPAETAPAE